MVKSIDNVNYQEAASADGVLELIHALMHQLRSRQFQVLRDGPHDLTPMESKVLGFFGRLPGGTLGDLAQHSGRDKAQLTRLIKGLRERGLLSAEADLTDRRQVRLSLSPEGLAVQRTLQRLAQQVAIRAVAGFSAAERSQLMALLQRLGHNLEGTD